MQHIISASLPCCHARESPLAGTRLPARSSLLVHWVAAARNCSLAGTGAAAEVTGRGTLEAG